MRNYLSYICFKENPHFYYNTTDILITSYTRMILQLVKGNT